VSRNAHVLQVRSACATPWRLAHTYDPAAQGDETGLFFLQKTKSAAGASSRGFRSAFVALKSYKMVSGAWIMRQGKARAWVKAERNYVREHLTHARNAGMAC
jgi:hypothetical protein